MRVLVKLLCMIGLTQALPAGGGEYNYAVGVGTTGLGSSGLGGVGLGGIGLGGGGGGGGGGFGGAGLGLEHEAPIISKHFYLHAAPEEEGGGVKRFTLGRPQRNYRVVFIKTPAVPKTRLAAEFAPNEEKTVIYVLAQKEHEFDPNDIATPAPTEPSKPEVFFIKYKTPEEAAHAQQTIQAQYDALGGASQVSDEGTVPVSSVIGSLGGQSGLSLGSAPSVGLAGLNNRYLPAKK